MGRGPLKTSCDGAPCLVGFNVSLRFTRHANTCITIITSSSFLTLSLSAWVKTKPQGIPVRLKPSKIKNDFVAALVYAHSSLIVLLLINLVRLLNHYNVWYSRTTGAVLALLESCKVFYFCAHCKSLWTWASANCLKYNCSLITLACALCGGQPFHLSQCDVINMFSGNRKAVGTSSFHARSA